MSMTAMLRAIELLLVDSDMACNAATPRKPTERITTATNTSIRPTPACDRLLRGRLVVVPQTAEASQEIFIMGTSPS
ncbi:hypothetical protein GCM10007863_03900 [Dyella mobilis]|nr:hypothetical protein GCM10007863_03900 [Dyella mobilis]